MLRWPAWILVVAWLCANSPQTACFGVISWVQQASHFSHQMRLVESASELLRDAPVERAVIAESTAPEPVSPLIPPDATVKKLELAAIEGLSELLPRIAAEHGWNSDEHRPVRRFRDVPHPPPRAGV